MNSSKKGWICLKLPDAEFLQLFGVLVESEEKHHREFYNMCLDQAKAINTIISASFMAKMASARLDVAPSTLFSLSPR